MNRILALALVLLTTLCFGQRASVVQNEVIVQLKKSAHPDVVVAEFVEEFGILPHLKWEKCLSQPLQAWLFSFDPQQASAREVSTMLATLSSVQVAQVNHIIAERVVPNDPFFGLQWHHSQPNNRDINTDLAWDITTGGVTATGDDIVVCVVEPQGTKWNQVDILPNHWINTHEIAGNSIDDDGNGYVDDVDGWNITNDTDNLSEGTHGTQVSSMIGAKGNNATGITGVNWDVKIMQVQLGGLTESNVIEAYTYPLNMRKLYNETSGALGAFVVATNSSWGTDFGQPADAPLWCAMYDTLGYYGVLSCGATANNDVNIDEVGDLPTACPSPHMISVTATNTNDVRTFSGYGTTHVDLGAPGEDVYLANNSSYGTTSGTSFATPCVAGAIALLYSAPCPTFMPLVYSAPAEAALLMRDYIFDGVTSVSNLAAETGTGGRMDVFASLNLLIQNCSSTDCLAPFSLQTQQEGESDNYIFTWNHIASQSQFNVRYRPAGAADWTTVENASTPLSVNALPSCTSYEFQVQSVCEDLLSDWSVLHTLITAGCCTHPTFANTISQMGSEIVISFESISAFDVYTLSIFNEGELVSTISSTTPEQQMISNLEPCTMYDIQIASNCESLFEPSVFPVFSQGCEDCTTIEHCPITGDSESEWIEEVQLNTLLHTSAGEPSGYGDYSHLGTQLVWGETYTITATPGFSGASYPENIRAWIDYNSDGDFDDSELIMDPETPSSGASSDSFTIPSNTLGSVTLRIAMSYYSTFGGGDQAVPCGNITFGEAQDYCVEVTNIISTPEIEENNNMIVYPNPCSHFLMVQGLSRSAFAVHDTAGRLVLSGTNGAGEPINTADLEAGLYTIQLTTTDGAVRTVKFIKE